MFERNELRRILAAAVSGIPDVEQTILRLHYIGELKLREISKILGLHESRIYQLRSHAIVRIRLYMAKRWPVGRLPPGLGWSPRVVGSVKSALSHTIRPLSVGHIAQPRKEMERLSSHIAFK